MMNFSDHDDDMAIAYKFWVEYTTTVNLDMLDQAISHMNNSLSANGNASSRPQQCAYLTIFGVHKYMHEYVHRPNDLVKVKVTEIKQFLTKAITEVLDKYHIEIAQYLRALVEALRTMFNSKENHRYQVSLLTLLIHAYHKLREVSGVFEDAITVLRDHAVHYELRIIGTEEIAAVVFEMAYAKSLSQWISAEQIPICQSLLGEFLCERYQRYANVGDVHRGLELVKQAHNKDPENLELLLNLGQALAISYDAFGKEEHLTDAIGHFKEIQEKARTRPASDQNKRSSASASINLGLSLKAQFERRGRLKDLEEGIKYVKLAVEETTGPPLLSQRLNILSTLWGRLYEYSGNLEYLDKAILHIEESLRTCREHPLVHHNFSNMSNYYAWRYKHDTKKYKDHLELAITEIKQSIQRSPPIGSHCPEYLASYCKLLGWKYKEIKKEARTDPGLLEEAIQVGKAAKDGLKPGSVAKLRAVHNLNEVLILQYVDEKDVETLKLATDQWNNILSDRSFPPVYAVNMAVEAVHLLKAIEEYKEALPIAQQGISLLAKASPRSIQAMDQQRILGRYAGLASDAAALVLECADESDLRAAAVEAVTLLEKGRGILADHEFQARNLPDLSQLKEEEPELALEFDTLIHTIDALGIDATARMETANKLDKVIERIQALKGFGNFLNSPTSAEIFQVAERYGKALVFINVSFRCDAVIIQGGHLIDLVSLGISSGDLTAIARDWNTAGPETCYKLLELLWNTITKPILVRLRTSSDNDLNKSSLRICWIPTGVLCRLPLHATGNYSQGPGNTVMDQSISSYGTTIKAIIYACQNRKQPIAETLSYLRNCAAVLVYMDETPKMFDLDYVRKEVGNIAHYLSPLLQPEAVLLLRKPKRKEVMDELIKSQLFHFAGHGSLNTDDISMSGLVMDDGCLTITDLLSLKLHKSPPLLAYLSACSTGVDGSRRLFDEHIHMVAACQTAGFQNVVGSLWAVKDQTSSNVSLKVYTKLFSDTSGNPRVSDALHAATKEIRMHANDSTSQTRDGNITDEETEEGNLKDNPKLWAAYFHMGLD